MLNVQYCTILGTMFVSCLYRCCVTIILYNIYRPINKINMYTRCMNVG